MHEKYILEAFFCPDYKVQEKSLKAIVEVEVHWFSCFT
jgi:hypothetical protein